MGSEPQRNATLNASGEKERADTGDPPPIERYEIVHPAVPEALDGLTILHLSDSHITRARFGGSLDESLLAALEATPVDLVALTGDYMSRPGDEAPAMEALWRMARSWRSRLGAVGIFGNHDSPRFRRMAMERIEGVRWLIAEAVDLDVDGTGLRVVGASDPEDLLSACLSRGSLSGVEGGEEHRHEDMSVARGDMSFAVTLAHQPSAIYAAASLGLPLVLAGHTHGGQIRITRNRLLHTAGDLPGDRASGILRLGETLCCVSRGLGEMLLPVRVNCPRQAPVYTLRRGELGSEGEGLRRVAPW